MKTIYRVYTNEPTNWGNEKVLIKLFLSLKRARTYFRKLVELTKQDAKETDNTLYVMLEDVNTNKEIEYKQLN